MSLLSCQTVVPLKALQTEGLYVSSKILVAYLPFCKCIMACRLDKSNFRSEQVQALSG